MNQWPHDYPPSALDAPRRVPVGWVLTGAENAVCALYACVGFFLPWMTSTPYLDSSAPSNQVTGWKIVATSDGTITIFTLHIWALLLLPIGILATSLLALRWRWWLVIEMVLAGCAICAWLSLLVGLVLGAGTNVTTYALGAYLEFVCFLICFALACALCLYAFTRPKIHKAQR